MRIKITFEAVWEVESEEQAYDIFLEYLNDCVHHGDVTPFKFEPVEESTAIAGTFTLKTAPCTVL